jgi:hypothetical protein
MDLFKRFFKKKLTVQIGSDESQNRDEYPNNHCFLFFGVNDSACSDIEFAFTNYDGPDAMGLYQNEEGGLFFPLCEQKPGSEKVVQARESIEDLRVYVDGRLDVHLNYLRDNGPPLLVKECLALIELEKPFIVDQISAAMSVWAMSNKFEEEDFIGAMLVFVKSSKCFDRADSLSANEDTLNLSLVTQVIPDIISRCRDSITVDYLPDVEDLVEETKGQNPRNTYNYSSPFMDDIPFGFCYFDQDTQLWKIDEVGRKSVTLASEYDDEFVDDGEDAQEFYVSH